MVSSGIFRNLFSLLSLWVICWGRISLILNWTGNLPSTFKLRLPPFSEPDVWEIKKYLKLEFPKCPYETSIVDYWLRLVRTCSLKCCSVKIPEYNLDQLFRLSARALASPQTSCGVCFCSWEKWMRDEQKQTPQDVCGEATRAPLLSGHHDTNSREITSTWYWNPMSNNIRKSWNICLSLYGTYIISPSWTFKMFTTAAVMGSSKMVGRRWRVWAKNARWASERITIILSVFRLRL